MLTEAQATFDVEKRREIMCELQTIMQEEGGVCIPCWFSSLQANSTKLKNFRASPSMYMLDEVWLDESA